MANPIAILVNVAMGFGIGLLQFVLSLFLAMGAVYIGIWAFDKMTKEIDEMKEIKKGNVAVGILMAAIVFSIANVIEGGVSNLVKLTNPSGGMAFVLIGLVIGLIQLLISIGVAAFAIRVALYVLSRITREFDDMAELKKGNVAVAILMAGVLFAVSFVIKAGIVGLTSAIDPVAIASQFY